jgi:hypothetical protein
MESSCSVVRVERCTKLAAQRAVAAAAGKSAAARVFQQPFLKLIPTMKQTVFAETQKALPKPAACAKPKAPAKDKPLTFDSRERPWIMQPFFN